MADGPWMFSPMLGCSPGPMIGPSASRSTRTVWAAAPAANTRVPTNATLDTM